jgi:hypothetical protein
MATLITRMAVINGSSSAEIQGVFRTIVERWRDSIRLAGLIAENHGLLDRACSAGFLRDVVTGNAFRFFKVSDRARRRVISTGWEHLPRRLPCSDTLLPDAILCC